MYFKFILALLLFYSLGVNEIFLHSGTFPQAKGSNNASQCFIVPDKTTG